MKFYGYWRSSSSWRVRIALHLKKLDFEYVPVNLVKDGGEQWRPEHRARNPMGMVPVLEVEDGGKVRHLAQSVAIIEYLDERFPEPRLLPGDAFARAQARMLAEHVNSGIQPLQNSMVLRRVKELLPGDPEADLSWVRYWLSRTLEGLEQAVRSTAGRCSMGDAITLPDLFVVPQMYSARRFKVDLAPFPTLVRIDEALSAHPAFQAAHADRQPDAPPPEKR